MSFPFFHRPGTLAFLDDDPVYLEMMALVMPAHWNVRLFLRPAECVRQLLQEPPSWEADAWAQQELVDHWRNDRALIPLVLQYWARHTERFGLTRVAVVDYSMPGMNGLEALARLTDWPGSRVLLTGQADEQVAVRAFNEGLIDQFIPKQTPDMARKVIATVDQLLAIPNARHSEIWRGTLTPDQNALLCDRTVARDLSAYAAKNWIEHVVIGAPFGVLGMDAAGAVSWLQLETEPNLAGLAELAECEGVSESGLEEIRSGRKLVDVELRQALERSGPPELGEALRIGDGTRLLGAVYRVDAKYAPAPACAYSQWLARQKQRGVRE
jgi:CheY-like chemotaxis protein